jgi:hypothetical protein
MSILNLLAQSRRHPLREQLREQADPSFSRRRKESFAWETLTLRVAG